MAVLEPGNRANVGKAAKALGWAPGQSLVLEMTGSQAAVRLGSPLTPAEHAVTVDDKGRLRLPPAALGCLGIGPGEQILAIAVPAWEALHLLAATDLLQAVTGWIEVEPQTLEEDRTAAPASRLRPRWAPPA